jgi:glycogen debranching enzyme
VSLTRHEKAAVPEDRVLIKQNDVFIVTDASGDVRGDNQEGYGLYRADTRYLSGYELRISGRPPILLSSSVDRAYVATFQLVNPTLVDATGPIPRQTLSLRRTRFVHRGFHERIGIKNVSGRAVDVELELRFEADFKDIFEVRRYITRSRRGVRRPPQPTEGGLSYQYDGTDRVRRRTEIVFHPMPEIEDNRATFHLHLEPHGHGAEVGGDVAVIVVDVLPMLGDEAPEDDHGFDAALAGLKRSYDRWNSLSTSFATDNQELDHTLLWRNLEDLRVLCNEEGDTLVPTAGVPWYAVPFGRDALITSLQTLALNPELARGTLRYLAAHQGRRRRAFQEEEPGKILHEMRFGELAAIHRIPHTPYYGSVDATPLFLVLLVELLEWTGDLALMDELREPVRAALDWIDTYGDADGDGFVEFGFGGAELASGQLRNRGWKDSASSLLTEDCAPPPPPIALVEVQAYVYRAKAGLAQILRRRGRNAEAATLEQQAEALRQKFERAFWMDDEAFYAQALDGGKRQVRSITSNPGHALWAGIVDPRRAAEVVGRLISPPMFSGWGVRTLSAGSPFYNPMSYHNGSVWPHDNSIVAAGMRRYGFRHEAAQVAKAVLKACMRFSDDRIPELYCGFGRDTVFNAGPARYLVSCSPQAWGAGALFHFLATLLGVDVNMLEGRLRIDPIPTSLFERVRVEGMRVGDGAVDFTVTYRGGHPTVTVDRRPPAVTTLELPS